MNFIKKNVPGMLLCLLIAIPAWYLGKLFPVVGGSVLAILDWPSGRNVPAVRRCKAALDSLQKRCCNTLSYCWDLI